MVKFEYRLRGDEVHSRMRKSEAPYLTAIAGEFQCALMLHDTPDGGKLGRDIIGMIYEVVEYHVIQDTDTENSS